MRCPKCGYISFDNVETCLKCNKNIAEATKAFQGSTLNVTTPVFLKISAQDPEEDMDIDDLADAADDIEFADPDLEILIDDEEEEGGIDFALNDEADQATDEADASLADEFGDMAGFGDDEEAEDEFSVDLGQFEEASGEEELKLSGADEGDEAAGMNMEFPEELSDISDLSPPEKDESVPPPPMPEKPAKLEAGSAAAEPDDDLDFSNLDMEFDLRDLDTEGGAASADPASAAEPSPRAAADMDEDLNFDLDLGGLSIHEDK